jgi:hypothetical protein
MIFSKDCMTWIEEWKFNLDNLNCYSYYWHNLNLKEVKRTKRNFGGGTVEVWGAFTYSSKLLLCFVPHRMKSKDYTDILEDVLIPFF